MHCSARRKLSGVSAVEVKVMSDAGYLPASCADFMARQLQNPAAMMEQDAVTDTV